MRMDDVWTPRLEQGRANLALSPVESGDPAGQVIPRHRCRSSQHTNPADGLVRGPRRMRLREDGHVVAVYGERLGEAVHVPSEAAVHQRRVLPGHHQDAHTAPTLPAGWAGRDRTAGANLFGQARTATR